MLHYEPWLKTFQVNTFCAGGHLTGVHLSFVFILDINGRLDIGLKFAKMSWSGGFFWPKGWGSCPQSYSLPCLFSFLSIFVDFFLFSLAKDYYWMTFCWITPASRPYVFGSFPRFTFWLLVCYWSLHEDTRALSFSMKSVLLLEEEYWSESDGQTINHWDKWLEKLRGLPNFFTALF